MSRKAEGIAEAPLGGPDLRNMALAIALGRRRLGLTWPNPAVGAVLVQDRCGAPIIVSQGSTAAGGRPHAEPLAIAAATGSLRRATLYVSLEPCSHHGRTPPCAEAIIRAGIGRVVAAIEDPDPRVAGRGHALLRAAGIEVLTGVGAADAARTHRGHFTRLRLGRPFVLLKLAQTSDGFAGSAGERLIITGPDANARTHMMRARSDAILVGIGTVLADDPKLDVRLPGLESRRPVRVVFDSRLRLPESSRVVATAAIQPTWVVVGEGASAEREARLRRHGVEVIRVAQLDDGRLDLASSMQELGRRGLTRVCCEGGPTLAAALAAADLVDEMVLITGSRPLGGAPGAISAVAPALAERLSEGFARARRLAAGSDLIETYERLAACSPVL